MSVSQVVSSRPATDDGQILRYTLNERIIHWLSGLTYVYCLMTGLAFWSPYMFWLADLVGGGPTARFWHPWFGLVFTVSIVWMYKIWNGDMRTTQADLKWKEAMPHYIRNEDENLPPIGRFNYGQKQFFWIMFYGAILMLLSGFGLWFVESIPEWLRLLSVTVHVIAAFATIGAFIIHAYMGTAVVRGGYTSIIRGEVSSDWAKMHHRLWYEQVTRGMPGKK